MKILLTGANGYIGTRLLPRLVEAGHEVYALVRSRLRFHVPESIQNHVHVLEADLLDPASLDKLPDDLDAAYYLVHSMSYAPQFAEAEAKSAYHFIERLKSTSVRQVIYLSGLANEEKLSHHLASRKQVGEILKKGKAPVTTLMAGIIVGSGSASFEIIRDLVEKLPVMVAPRWVDNLVQPIAVRNVLDYLLLVLNHPDCIGKAFEIGGPDILSYKEMLLGFAEERKLRRRIISLPFFTPNLSSYWLVFITRVNFSLARSLVESLKNNAVCKENRIQQILPLKLLTYPQSLQLTLERIEQDWVPSSWKDSMSGSGLNPDLSHYMQVPSFGVFVDCRKTPLQASVAAVQKRIWSLGGETGWLTMDWAWSLRGFIDQLLGGTGLRRGRTHPEQLEAGDALDFWRVLLADEQQHRLLLYAEMKLPGEAWLEFQITKDTLLQTATFRPRGVWGRIYWYLLYPFHAFIFRQLSRKLAEG